MLGLGTVFRVTAVCMTWGMYTNDHDAGYGGRPHGPLATAFCNWYAVTHHTYCQVLMSCGVRMDSRAVCIWTAEKQKRKYISGIASMSAGQILVIIIIFTIFFNSINPHMVKVIL